MTPLPNYCPKQLALGPLETEVLSLIWELGAATVKDLHSCLLAREDRCLASASVTTVLHRLTKKGWLAREPRGRVFYWRTLVTKEQAQAIEAHEKLQQFLAVGHPDVVAAFADSLDAASLEQLEASAHPIQAARLAREESY